MAKRRRLEGVPPMPSPGGPDAPGFARETTGLPPIAHVARDIAGQAALAEMSAALASARDEGRLIVRLPLGSIAADHLARDRIALDEGEMATLMDSLARRGQQVPVEVVALGQEGYGLISGWRRLEALRRLGVAEALALVRQPDSAADAYLAMVEENEIRAGLSFYERARLAVEAARLGIHPDPQTAVRALFQAAPAPKRSKIAAFVHLHDALGQALRFPAAIPEHLGLALVGILRSRPEAAADWAAALAEADPGSAEAERAVLDAILREPDKPRRTRRQIRRRASGGDEVAPGVRLEAARGRLVLSGRGVTEALRRDLAEWLSLRGVSHAKPR